jgi:DNA-binding response OmpR family regulator
LLEVDLDSGTALMNARELNLTRREFDLLAFLASHPGRVYSRQDLLDRVWGLDFMGGERTVDQHITQLRAHLDDDPIEPRFVETVRGKGYRMRAPVTDEVSK